MTGRRVAVQVDASRGLEHPPQFHKSNRHHRQVGEHVVVAQQLPKSLHGQGDPAARFHDFMVRGGHGLIPLPRILESSHLRGKVGKQARVREKQR